MTILSTSPLGRLIAWSVAFVESISIDPPCLSPVLQTIPPTSPLGSLGSLDPQSISYFLASTLLLACSVFASRIICCLVSPIVFGEVVAGRKHSSVDDLFHPPTGVVRSSMVATPFWPSTDLGLDFIQNNCWTTILSSDSSCIRLHDQPPRC